MIDGVSLSISAIFWKNCVCQRILGWDQSYVLCRLRELHIINACSENLLDSNASECFVTPILALTQHNQPINIFCSYLYTFNQSIIRCINWNLQVSQINGGRCNSSVSAKHSKLTQLCQELLLCLLCADVFDVAWSGRSVFVAKGFLDGVRHFCQSFKINMKTVAKAILPSLYRCP